LIEQPADQRVLVVISDGYPAGEHSGPLELVDAVSQLTLREDALTLVGVGIGPDTAHVREFYPQAVADVPVGSFARTIAALLEDALVGGVRRAPCQNPTEIEDEWEVA